MAHHRPLGKVQLIACKVRYEPIRLVGGDHNTASTGSGADLVHAADDAARHVV